ncbi:Dapdiamide synthesis protein DdaD [Bienertia sinuspersici]
MFSEIDRIMENEDWMDEYEQARAIFFGRHMVRNHSNAPDYKERVNRAWHWKGQGTEIYRLTRRLKQVKKELKDLNKNGFSSIQAASTKAYQELTDVQKAFMLIPGMQGWRQLKKKLLIITSRNRRSMCNS